MYYYNTIINTENVEVGIIMRSYYFQINLYVIPSSQREEGMQLTIPYVLGILHIRGRIYYK